MCPLFVLEELASHMCGRPALHIFVDKNSMLLFKKLLGWQNDTTVAVPYTRDDDYFSDYFRHLKEILLLLRIKHRKIYTNLILNTEKKGLSRIC